MCFATKFINIGEFWLTGRYCNLSIIGFIIINCCVDDIFIDYFIRIECTKIIMLYKYIWYVNNEIKSCLLWNIWFKEVSVYYFWWVQ